MRGKRGRSHYTISPEAAFDIESIREYFGQIGNRPAGRNVIGQIREAIQFLALTPGAGHFREDLTDYPVKFWPVSSYLVIYDHQRSPIEIVRVLHGNRDIEFIMGSKHSPGAA